MANHPLVALLLYAGEWHDVHSNVSQMFPVTITQPGSEVSNAPNSSRIGLTFEDPDGVYRPYLPTSPLYDLAGRNTPMLIGDDMGREDFEDTTFSFTWGFAGIGTWTRSSTQAHAGTWSFKSPALTDGQQGNWQIDMPTGTTSLVFWYWTDISSTSFLAVYNEKLDLIWFASGASAGWYQATVDLTGSSSVLFSYQRNSSAGTNTCYVDDLIAVAGQFAEVASWDPDPGNPGDPPVTDVIANGALGRISQWTAPIQSALTEYLVGATALVIDWWPMEEPRGTNRLINVAGGADGTLADHALGDAESPQGGSTTCQLAGTSNLGGVIRNSPYTSWQIIWTQRFPVDPDSMSSLDFAAFATTTGHQILIGAHLGAFDVTIFNSSGSTVDSGSVLFGDAAPSSWMLYNLLVTFSGGTTTWKLLWYEQNDSLVQFFSSSFSGSIGAPSQWAFLPNSYTDNGWVGQVYVTGNASSALADNTDLRSAFNGWSGERAGTRFLRLLQEKGAAGVFYGDPEDTEQLGPQRPDTLINLLREIRDTEGGVIADSPGQMSVSLRGRRSLYNQTPALELTYGINVARPFRPVLDALSTNNLITVSQPDGTTATAEDTTSRMGTQAPPEGVGVYKQNIGVNALSNTRLPDLASWWRAIGTNPEPRFEAVTVDLDANPELEGAVAAVRSGDRITVAGYLPDLIDLIVVGKTDNRENQRHRKVTFTCAPYRPYAVAVYDGGRRYNARTNLNAGYGTTDTSMVVTFTDIREAWSTTSAPYDWDLAGERITVTSMGAVTGSGPWTQSATVTRSVNGVVKDHTAGERPNIHPQQVARYAI